MFSKVELEHLREALGEYMSDEYGDENEEGCWEADSWDELLILREKLELLYEKTQSPS